MSKGVLRKAVLPLLSSTFRRVVTIRYPLAGGTEPRTDPKMYRTLIARDGSSIHANCIFTLQNIRANLTDERVHLLLSTNTVIYSAAFSLVGTDNVYLESLNFCIEQKTEVFPRSIRA